MPFNILNLWHQLKKRFTIEYIKHDTTSDGSQELKIVHEFLRIKEWWGIFFTKLDKAISGQHMGGFSTPDGAFERLCPTRVVVPSPQSQGMTHQHQVAFQDNNYQQWQHLGHICDGRSFIDRPTSVIQGGNIPQFFIVQQNLISNILNNVATCLIENGFQ